MMGRGFTPVSSDSRPVAPSRSAVLQTSRHVPKQERMGKCFSLSTDNMTFLQQVSQLGITRVSENNDYSGENMFPTR